MSMFNKMTTNKKQEGSMDLPSFDIMMSDVFCMLCEQPMTEVADKNIPPPGEVKRPHIYPDPFL